MHRTHGQRASVVLEQPSDKGRSATQQGDGLVALQGPQHARHWAKRSYRRPDPCVGWRQILEQAAVAGPSARGHGEKLATQARDRGMHQWGSGQDRGVVAQELGVKVVRCIHQHGTPLQQARGAGGVEAGLYRGHFDRGIALRERGGKRSHLGRTNSRVLVQHLAVQVALFHDVVVNHHQATQASRGQRKRRTTAQSARSNQQDRFFKYHLNCSPQPGVPSAVTAADAAPVVATDHADAGIVGTEPAIGVKGCFGARRGFGFHLAGDFILRLGSAHGRRASGWRHAGSARAERAANLALPVTA